LSNERLKVVASTDKEKEEKNAGLISRKRYFDAKSTTLPPLFECARAAETNRKQS
jgi:hypothetical protein